MELARKLQLGADQAIRGVEVLAALSAALAWEPGEDVGTTTDAALLVFVKARAELDAHRGAIVAAASVDRLTWVAYPKGGQLHTDLKRDSLAATLAESGIRAVRQVSLDEVWSALRFRPG